MFYLAISTIKNENRLILKSFTVEIIQNQYLAMSEEYIKLCKIKKKRKLTKNKKN